MSNREKIRALNDDLRIHLKGGRIALTPGILALSDVSAVIQRVREFSDFDSGNNPHGDRDFGSFKMSDGTQVMFKIDCYDPELQMGSPDPSDPAVTARVMTILLGDEY